MQLSHMQNWTIKLQVLLKIKYIFTWICACVDFVILGQLNNLCALCFITERLCLWFYVIDKVLYMGWQFVFLFVGTVKQHCTATRYVHLIFPRNKIIICHQFSTFFFMNSFRRVVNYTNPVSTRIVITMALSYSNKNNKMHNITAI